MKALCVFFTSLAIASTCFAAKPNILFLLSDDHCYPFLSCYGDKNVKTLTLDRLAAEGMKIHCFFTAAPQCVPSRAALMTGRSPDAAQITRFSAPLARDEITLPELLRDQAGYFTGICGRLFHLDGSGLKSEESSYSRDTICAPLMSAFIFSKTALIPRSQINSAHFSTASLRNLFYMLDVHSRAAAVARALRENLM